MKLIRFGEPGNERPGLILPDGRRVDVSGFGADYDEAFFGSGGLGRLADWLAMDGRSAPEVRDDVRLGPSAGRARSCASASITAITPGRRGRHSRRSPSSFLKRPPR